VDVFNNTGRIVKNISLYEPAFVIYLCVLLNSKFQFVDATLFIQPC